MSQTRSLYFCRDRRGKDLVKIGISIHPEQRMKEVNGELILAIRLDYYQEAADAEQALHKRWNDRRVEGEWFRNHPFLGLYIHQLKWAYIRYCDAQRAAVYARMELEELLGIA